MNIKPINIRISIIICISFSRSLSLSVTFSNKCKWTVVFNEETFRVVQLLGKSDIKKINIIKYKYSRGILGTPKGEVVRDKSLFTKSIFFFWINKLARWVALSKKTMRISSILAVSLAGWPGHWPTRSLPVTYPTKTKTRSIARK